MRIMAGSESPSFSLYVGNEKNPSKIRTVHASSDDGKIVLYKLPADAKLDATISCEGHTLDQNSYFVEIPALPNETDLPWWTPSLAQSYVSPETTSISGANAVATVVIGDAVPTTSATATLYTDGTFATSITSSSVSIGRLSDFYASPEMTFPQAIPWYAVGSSYNLYGVGKMNKSKISKALIFSGIMLIISIVSTTFFGTMLIIPNNGFLDRFTSIIGLLCGIFTSCIIFYDGIFKELRC